jgi:Calcineurin-like phosphoesterase
MSLWNTAAASAPASFEGYDVIGDIHGHHDKLVALLRHLGYRRRQGAWRHRTRQAIFVGDLVDRGPRQVDTVELVRAMVDAGAAQCCMGNHEFNSVAWATEDPENPGKYLRCHDRPGNYRQHRAFLQEVQGTPKHRELTDWFKTLPLWLDLGGLRVVHACWQQEAMDQLAPHMGPNQTLTDELFVTGSRKSHWAYEAIETLCKGPQLDLPAGASFTDQDGKVRKEVRLRWWQPDLKNYREAAIGPAAEIENVPDVALPESALLGKYTGVPVIFGHYWFSGDPTVISPKFACVDFSAAYEGPLVAYRWDGERELSTAKLAWVPSRAHPR